MGYLAAVFQDFSLFAFSLAENVAGSREYEGERVLAALEKVGLSGLVAGYPKGISQPLFHDFDEEGGHRQGRLQGRRHHGTGRAHRRAGPLCGA